MHLGNPVVSNTTSRVDRSESRTFAPGGPSSPPLSSPTARSRVYVISITSLNGMARDSEVRNKYCFPIEIVCCWVSTTDLSGLSALPQISGELCPTFQCFRSRCVSAGCHFYGLKRSRALSSDRSTWIHQLHRLFPWTKPDGFLVDEVAGAYTSYLKKAASNQ